MFEKGIFTKHFRKEEFIKQFCSHLITNRSLIDTPSIMHLLKMFSINRDEILVLLMLISSNLS